jgi:hypothetical protein
VVVCGGRIERKAARKGNLAEFPRVIALAGFWAQDSASPNASAQGRAMSFLLDTNLLSEPMKERPNSGVLEWLSQANEDEVFVSVVTITELRYGVELTRGGKLGERLEKLATRKICSSVLKEESFQLTSGSRTHAAGRWPEANPWVGA